MALGLDQIDWSAPWLAPWREKGLALSALVQQGMGQHAACNALAHPVSGAGLQETQGVPVRFVAQSDLPEGQAYEQFIFETQCVPTREGLHDFFNALCWLRFPLAKQQLNRVQAAAISAQGVGAVRGPVRDAVTVFDENAALLQAPDAIWTALAQRDGQRAFVTLRPLWQDAQAQIFGHSALEKLVRPYKAITVHFWRVPPELPSGMWDAWLAQDLQVDKLALKPFLPTPVLGVPAWWADNQNPDFYDDPQVFRAARST